MYTLTSTNNGRRHTGGFTLIEVVAVATVLLVLMGIVLLSHTETHESVDAIRKEDAVGVLNQAEAALLDYVNNVEPSLANAVVVSTNAAYTSSTASVRAGFLYQNGFLGREIDTTGLTVSKSGFRWMWRN